YILADDLGYGELGCYGQKKIRTPHLDRLASQGMRFTRHYCGAPVCAPSRCVLLTGKHLGHARIRGNREQKPEGQLPIHADDLTIATVLRQRGYATAAVGKWGLGPVGSTGDPNAHGFDLFFGYNCQRVAHSYYPPHLWRNTTKVLLNEHPVSGHHRPKPGAEIDFSRYHGAHYAPPRMLAEALAFIRQNRDRPFYLHFAPVEPHVAMQPPEALVQSYPEEWDRERGPYRGGRGYLPHPRPRAGYAAMITDLDRHVGAVLALLDELSLADNTVVMFSSDNGPTHDVGGVDTAFFDSTGGLRGRKGSVYEGGIRVPMLARWPKHIAAGSTSAHPSGFFDVMATLCELSGATAPPNDGISFLPTLLGRAGQRVHPHMVWDFAGYGGQQALLFGGWKLVRTNLHRPRQPKAKVRVQLFDLEHDPAEAHDVAAQHPGMVQEALRILQAEHTANPDFPLAALGER
ncbi:MAG: arylsulfatase, partial [Planctomycetes bacterium]|nr:arylsulfatase [Planctomycetota bacterium]